MHLNGGEALIGMCETCRQLQAVQDRRQRENESMMAGEDEPDGDDEDALHILTPAAHCCMRKVLSQQADFREEKHCFKSSLRRPVTSPTSYQNFIAS